MLDIMRRHVDMTTCIGVTRRLIMTQARVQHAMSTHRANSNRNQIKEEQMTTIIAMERRVKSEVVEVTRSM